MQTKRKRRNFSFPVVQNHRLGSPGLSRSPDLLAGLGHEFLIRERISASKLSLASWESVPAVRMACRCRDLLISPVEAVLEGYVAWFARNRGNGAKGTAGMAGRTCPTFPPRTSPGNPRLRVAEPRCQSRVFRHDVGQPDTAAGFPGA